MKSQTGKFPFGIALLLTIIKEQPDGEGTKPSGVMNWKDMTNDQAWNYYQSLDKREAKVLENKADELNMSCLYVKNSNNPKLMETLMTQFSLGVDNFPRSLEESYSIHSTAFRKESKHPNKGSNDDDTDNSNEGENNELIGAHLTIDKDNQWDEEDLIFY